MSDFLAITLASTAIIWYSSSDMKTAIHPEDYRVVVFEDLNDGTQFLSKSTAKSEDMVKWTDGNTYPLIKVHISSSSHPFYTGQEKLMDVEGRVDKFKARAEAAKKAREAKQTGKSKPKEKTERTVQKIEGLKTSRKKSKPPQKQK